MNIHTFLEELNLYISEYLEVLPDNDGEERYDSYQGLAQDQLAKFVGWIRVREAIMVELQYASMVSFDVKQLLVETAEGLQRVGRILEAGFSDGASEQ